MTKGMSIHFLGFLCAGKLTILQLNHPMLLEFWMRWIQQWRMVWSWKCLIFIMTMRELHLWSWQTLNVSKLWFQVRCSGTNAFSNILALQCVVHKLQLSTLDAVKSWKYLSDAYNIIILWYYSEIIKDNFKFYYYSSKRRRQLRAIADIYRRSLFIFLMSNK